MDLRNGVQMIYGRRPMGASAVLSVILLFGIYDRAAGNGDQPSGSVHCVVRLEGNPPEMRVIKLDAEMQAAMGVAQYQEQSLLVGKEQGVANCVVLLRAENPQQRSIPRPLEPATFAKVGVRFEPRVLIVTPETDVYLTNDKSPCRGFEVLSCRYDDHRFAHMVLEGHQKTVRFHKSDVCEIGCRLRPYARGFVIVADTPHYAVTDADGRAMVGRMPPGKYEVSLWHESIDRRQKKEVRTTVIVKAGETTQLQLWLSAPK